VILYHVTPAKNVVRIRRDGLTAQCGDGCVGLNKSRIGVYFWRHRAAAEGNPWGGPKRLKGKAVVTVEIPDRFVHLLERDEEFFEDETEAWVFPLGVPPSWIRETKKSLSVAPPQY
jgi:hypothetical protein